MRRRNRLNDERPARAIRERRPGLPEARIGAVFQVMRDKVMISCLLFMLSR